MLTLLAKDFKLMFGKEKGLLKKILTLLLTILFIACFIGIEVFLFTTILGKIETFKDVSITFISLFLFIVCIITVLTDVANANKLFFNEKDIEQLSIHPVSNSSIILSKLIFLFFTHYMTCFIFSYPLFCAYGIKYSMTMDFFYIALFYPILSFFFEMGIALLVVYPYWLAKKWLKKHLLVKFILNIVLLFIGCFLYSKVLNIFIEIVAGNNFNALFTVDNINALVNLKKYQIPTKFLVDIFVARNYTKIFSYMVFALGVFLLGVAIVIFAFNYIRNISVASVTKNKEPIFKEKKVWKALVKKEIILLLKNAEYTLSFTGLLIAQPYLVYLVIKILNTIFTTGVFSYYISVVPNFVPLMDVLILMLFSVIISQGANSYIQMEKKTIKVMKTIPIGSRLQMFIKIMIPFSMSFVSLLISLLVLFISGIISFITFIFSLILVGLLLFVFNLVSLKEELNIRHHKPRSTFISNLYSYLLPMVFFLVTVLLSYIGLPLVIAFIIGIVPITLLGIPYAVVLYKKMDSLFLDLDVVN